MASLDLLRRHLVVTTAVAGLLLGGIIGLFLPIRAASPPKSLSEAWALPAIGDTKRFSEDAYMTLRSARFWKTVAVPGQRDAPKLEWTLTAIITRPRPMAVISRPGGASDSSASKTIVIGAEFPDGSTLVRMTRDAVWFEKDGCLRERRLYRPVTAENNACFGEEVPSTPDARTPTALSASSSPPPPEPPVSGRQNPLPPPRPIPAVSAPSAPTQSAPATQGSDPLPAPAVTPAPQPVEGATP